MKAAEQIPLSEFLLIQRIQKDYIHVPNRQEMTDEAINGMLRSLDPYSSYFTSMIGLPIKFLSFRVFKKLEASLAVLNTLLCSTKRPLWFLVEYKTTVI